MPFETLIDQLHHLLETQPDRECITLITHNDEYTLTYREFFDRAARYASMLKMADLQAGDLVVLVLQHGEAVMCGFWGALLTGRVPSIFPFLSDKQNPESYFNSIRQLVALSGVKAILTSVEFEQGLREALDGIDVRILTIEMLATNGIDLDTNLLTAGAGDTAFLQHSSGSTGLQKGVMLSHGAVMNQIASYSATIQLSPDDVVVSWLPLYHDMGLIAGFIMPIVQGIKLVLMSPFHWVRDPQILLRAIQRYHGTLCWLPNFAYNFLATRVSNSALENLDLSSIRAFINCSEPIHAESHRLFAERFAPHGLRADTLTTCYAMAENTFAVTQSSIGTTVRVDMVDRRELMGKRLAIPTDNNVDGMSLVSCGEPIFGCEIKIVDVDRQPLTERRIGEIALRSNSMLSGYYYRPELTQQVIHDGWYFTGDMGYIANKELYITGRKKDLIIVGGKNIYPQDIENLLNVIEGIHPGRIAVFGLFNEQLGTEDIAIVAEADLEDEEAHTAIKREIRARIAQNTDVTARYVQLVEEKWVIKTSSGKVARDANRQKFIQEFLPPDK
jgi:fatty-acyl-CoA synthase